MLKKPQKHVHQWSEILNASIHYLNTALMKAITKNYKEIIIV